MADPQAVPGPGREVFAVVAEQVVVGALGLVDVGEGPLYDLAGPVGVALLVVAVVDSAGKKEGKEKMCNQVLYFNIKS